MTMTIAKWTVAEYHQMIAAGILVERCVELLNGEIVEMAPEGEFHAYTSDEAAEYLIYLLGERAKVRQGKPITLPQNNSEPEPDIAVVQRLGRNYREHHPYPENIFWLIEYSNSTLSKDLEVKSKIYAAVGIPEYWVINLQNSEVVVFRSPTNTGYNSQEILSQGVIVPLAFRELEVSVERLFGE
ncbi:MAG: Uma2 family endonuclease [Okeania sp. SIO3B5]|uniref:Uma2 family endonuclease n=1 Tax=Okeania sp. SIO3B5 TaxID=2607811 RepID=UPI0014015E87|nr:Uma2 family endonuclease [Okeania sp. SIO3B5]NEO57093.1 Uma2 family endonuclease [Okeania sp. SIO3B5]